MENNIDFRKHLCDFLENPPDGDEERLKWEFIVEQCKAMYILLKEVQRMKDPDLDPDELAFYQIEEYIVPFHFNRGNYIGSIEFSEDQPWKPIFVEWIYWLRTEINPRDETARIVIQNNVDKLDTALKDPNILGDDPYPFLGSFANYATILLRYAEGMFSMDYYYNFSASTDKNRYGCAMTRANYSFPGGGIIGIDSLQVERRFDAEKAELLTFDKFFKTGKYSPLTKENLIEVLEEKNIGSERNRIIASQVWPPFQRVKPHSEGDFPDLADFIEKIMARDSEGHDEEYDPFEDDV